MKIRLLDELWFIYSSVSVVSALAWKLQTSNGKTALQAGSVEFKGQECLLGREGLMEDDNELNYGKCTIKFFLIKAADTVLTWCIFPN